LDEEEAAPTISGSSCFTYCFDFISDELLTTGEIFDSSNKSDSAERVDFVADKVSVAD
jgi:hypothetical protein